MKKYETAKQITFFPCTPNVFVQKSTQVGNKGEKLPNNTVFSKKILDFFLFLCVFGTALNYSAYAEFSSASFTCSCITNSEDCSDSELYQVQHVLQGNNNEEKCKSVKGCKYVTGVLDGCVRGTGTYYTDYTISNCNTSTNCETNCCVTSCPDDYPLSAAGSWSIDQCYKYVNCAGETEATASDTTPAKCRIYYSGKVVCTSATSEPSCNGIWDTSFNNICDLNQASFLGFTDNDDNLSYEYHRETINETPGCYSNTRACNLFTTDTNVSGNAEWVSGDGDNNPGHWNVSGCLKTESFDNSNQITIFNSEHPNCTGVKVSKPTDNNTSVNSATDQITYTGVGYFCTKCDPGYSITNPLSSNSNLQLFNNQGSNYVSSNYCTTNNSNSAWPAANNQPFYVCKCIEVANGYYVDQQQTICNFTNNDADCHLNVDELTSFDNVVKKCPAGKTGPNGAIDQAQCYYGNYYSPASQNNSTQFCDAFGCVWLDGLSFDSINQTYSWTGDVHLVGVSNDENADYLCPVYPDPPHFWGYDKDGNPIDARGNTVNCGN